TIKKDASVENAKIPFGTTLLRKDAILLTLMASDDQSALTLAKNYPDGVSAFVEKMNEKAQKLGMKQTFFMDPTGFSEGNVSSAKDLSKLLTVAARYPEIREYSVQSKYELKLENKTLVFKNTNKLAASPQWKVGVLKDNIPSEKFSSLLIQSRMGDRPIKIVLMDSPNEDSKIHDANRIREWILSQKGPSEI
ncbi:MAG TPA: hypothetical protein VIY47_15545, partial [Ignavibacteriaceae bacterium]